MELYRSNNWDVLQCIIFIMVLGISIAILWTVIRIWISEYKRSKQDFGAKTTDVHRRDK